ncbi:hypothetical protein [Actinophytocola sp.]|uniref:hypothetical protein n=1 Tax=Actinophytocola sp. TaxID=1872138 RepID=UPI002D5737E9|nr:hypothetical protein [Actinophytocola sp.]HYQ68400.1 hypothetical protein [Actinophytocola sp.]
MRSFPALGFDPAPGEADAVQTLLLQLATAGELIDATLPRLEEAAKITDDAEWGGSAAEEFSDHGDDLPRGLGKGGEAIGAVASALSTWYGTLVANQARAEVLEAAARKLRARLATFDTCTPESTAVSARLGRVVDDARRLEARHLRAANAAADAVRGGKDGDPFEPENDAWYVQAVDGIAVASDGVSLATGTLAAGLAATGVGVVPAAALEVASSGAGAVGSLAALGQQLAGSRHAPGWTSVVLGLGTSVVPGGGTAAAAVRSGGRVALRRGSRAAVRAARKDITAAATGGGVPGIVNNAARIRAHGLEGKVSRDLTAAGREVARREGVDLPANLADRKAELQRLGLAAKQQEAYANLVDKGTSIAEKAGVDLTPEQKAELKLLQQGINPTPKQLDKAVEDLAKDALK